MANGTNQHRAITAPIETQSSNILGDALLGAIRQAVREEFALISQNGHREGDKLLDAEEAANILSVSPDWLYRRANRLPSPPF